MYELERIAEAFGASPIILGALVYIAKQQQTLRDLVIENGRKAESVGEDVDGLTHRVAALERTELDRAALLRPPVLGP